MAKRNLETDEVTVNETDKAENRLEELVREYEQKLKELDEKSESCSEKSGNLKFIGNSCDDDYVELCLFRDGGKYKDDVLVGINGKMCQIKRGVPVKIKRSFANVIASSQESAAHVQVALSENDGKMIHI